MKLRKFLFYFILALSLSAICLTLSNISTTAVSASTIIENNLINLENNQNSYINLSDEEYVEVFKENNQMLYLTQSDIYLMSQVVYAESKGEPYEGKVGVASVILNRALNKGFPDTIQGVIFQPKAFSCIVNGNIDVNPTQECFDAVYDGYLKNLKHCKDAEFDWFKTLKKAELAAPEKFGDMSVADLLGAKTEKGKANGKVKD